MLATVGNRFNFDVHNISTTVGTTITPGQNTFPAYAEILSDTVVTQDCYDMSILIWLGTVAAASKDTLVNIGSDPAGGTTFATIIPNLLATDSAFLGSSGCGFMYRFPLFVKAGTSLAAQASVNNATVGTIRVVVRLFGAPTRPEVVKCGSYVDSFGANTAASNGTTVTPGVSYAKGSYVQLGSNAAKDYWWWQTGLGCSDADMQSAMYFSDLAAGSSTTVNDRILPDEFFNTNTSESMNKACWLPTYYAEVPSGVGIYGRAATSVATADTGVSMIAYGLGG